MGKVVPITRLPSSPIDVYTPVNYRPTDRCKIFVFDPADENHYATHFNAQGVQYAEGENLSAAYHIIETPDSMGALLRYTAEQPDGTINVFTKHDRKEYRKYPKDDVKILGLVFQFITNLKTGDRWEFIRGPAQSGELSTERAIYDVSG